MRVDRRRLEAAGGDGQNQALRRPADVDRDQVEFLVGREAQRVRPLVHDDARVAPESAVEHAVAGVNCVDFRCPALQEAVDKSADVAAEIGADEAPDLDIEGLKGSVELEAAAGDEWSGIRHAGIIAKWTPSAVRFSVAVSAAVSCGDDVGPAPSPPPLRGLTGMNMWRFARSRAIFAPTGQKLPIIGDGRRCAAVAPLREQRALPVNNEQVAGGIANSRSGWVWHVLRHGFVPAFLVGLALWLREEQRKVGSQPATDTPAAATASLPPPSPSPELRLTELIRMAQLFTVELRAPVAVEVADECWRGTATARVAAPARFLYGVDLARLSPMDVSMSSMLGIATVTLDPPKRLATELDMGSPQETVEVRGLRLRAMAGERVLGLARLTIQTQATRAYLSARDEMIVREESRQRVAELISRLSGDGRPVIVRFSDEAPREIALAGAAQ